MLIKQDLVDEHVPFPNRRDVVSLLSYVLFYYGFISASSLLILLYLRILTLQNHPQAKFQRLQKV